MKDTSQRQGQRPTQKGLLHSWEELVRAARNFTCTELRITGQPGGVVSRALPCHGFELRDRRRETSKVTRSFARVGRAVVSPVAHPPRPLHRHRAQRRYGTASPGRPQDHTTIPCQTPRCRRMHRACSLLGVATLAGDVERREADFLLRLAVWPTAAPAPMSSCTYHIISYHLAQNGQTAWASHTEHG